MILVWRFGEYWLQLPNLMYANTTYNHVLLLLLYYEQCTLSIAKLKSPPMCVMSQFAKLIVHQVAIPPIVYTVYSYSYSLIPRPLFSFLFVVAFHKQKMEKSSLGTRLS